MSSSALFFERAIAVAGERASMKIPSDEMYVLILDNNRRASIISNIIFFKNARICDICPFLRIVFLSGESWLNEIYHSVLAIHAEKGLRRVAQVPLRDFAARAQVLQRAEREGPREGLLDGGRPRLLGLRGLVELRGEIWTNMVKPFQYWVSHHHLAAIWQQVPHCQQLNMAEFCK